MDVRLLSAVAETGRAAVPDLAARLGMDVRDVASRLAALSGTGLPLVVGVECDTHAIRNAIAAANAWNQQHSGAYPAQPAGHPASHSAATPHSGSYPVQNQPSGPYPTQGRPGGPATPHSGPHPTQNQPSGPHPMQGQLSGGHRVPIGYAAASGPHGVAQPYTPQPPLAQGNAQPPQATGNTWGPPGSAAWTRGDQKTTEVAPVARPRTGSVGSKLDVDGPDGERMTIQLVEVVDPGDFLFTAAGHELQDGERSVVVHTELTNRGTQPLTSLPDQYLVLVAADGSSVAKSTVTLSSRPPHRIGVQPGETTGGHTLYVLPEDTVLSSLRWSPHPNDVQHTLTWDLSDL
ncbi:AsnC family protein [Allosaccharopolyspora coralli]|uniref:AsnC family protein n=1 Tax=Allosaccharopolyspora coralli TaxID=2665642 RepID=A0A5Q3QCX3_9PSEU|nr:AsnC family protein [Allosaccharopolyspora coralli]